MRKFLLLAFLPILLLSGCDRSGDKVTVHCDNLVNEALPAGDNARIWVAKAFTPNGDGMNDSFWYNVIDGQVTAIKIYDEQGNLIFQGTNSFPWPSVTNGQSRKFYYRIEAHTNSNHTIGACGEVYALYCYPPGTGKANYSFQDQWTPNGFTGITNEQLNRCQ